MDYPLPNVDNRGHLVNHHLPHFVHVVIERPPESQSSGCHQKVSHQALVCTAFDISIFWSSYTTWDLGYICFWSKCTLHAKGGGLAFLLRNQ